MQARLEGLYQNVSMFETVLKEMKEIGHAGQLRTETNSHRSLI